jgi:hypothetical protein
MRVRPPKHLVPVGGAVVGLLLIQLSSLPSRAQTRSEALGRVEAIVPPSVAVAAIQPTWDVTVLQSGSFSATLAWRIEANVPSLQMTVEASDLFMADDPGGTEVAPIPLDTSRPIVITAEHANQAEGGSNRAFWVGPGTPIGAFPTNRTETVTFESSQPYIFDQLVSTQIFFNQPENIKPMGSYSGRVKITTMIPAAAALGR